MANTNTNYNYMEAMKKDIKDYMCSVIISDFSDREELENFLNEVLWAEDSVTGNGSGSYTFNSYQAEKYICHNLDLLQKALEEFGETDINILKNGAEWCDVIIRCYLLGQAIAEVLENMENELEEAFNTELVEA